MDWTVKLWSHDRNGPEKSLQTFDHGTNYVYDVQWSPTHPAVFASIDGAGLVHLWDLNVDMEQAVEVVDVREDAEVEEKYRCAACIGLRMASGWSCAARRASSESSTSRWSSRAPNEKRDKV